MLMRRAPGKPTRALYLWAGKSARAIYADAGTMIGVCITAKVLLICLVGVVRGCAGFFVCSGHWSGWRDGRVGMTDTSDAVSNRSKSSLRN